MWDLLHMNEKWINLCHEILYSNIEEELVQTNNWKAILVMDNYDLHHQQILMLMHININKSNQYVSSYTNYN